MCPSLPNNYFNPIKMFLTITIDTSKKTTKSRKADVLSWWKKPLNPRKRTLSQKIENAVKSLRGYKNNYRPAMF